MVTSMVVVALILHLLIICISIKENTGLMEFIAALVLVDSIIILVFLIIKCNGG